MNDRRGICGRCRWLPRWVWHGVFFWLGAAGLFAGELLQPPFGLKWGDSPEKLLDWAARQTLDATIRLPGDQPNLRVLRIEARKGFLPETRAAAVEARFFLGRLYELTVDYSDVDAPANVMEARFEELRKQLAQEHGKLLANQQERSVEDQFVTRTQAYHREAVKGLFLLVAATEVEDLLRKTREFRFSVIYRNENFREQLEAEAHKP